MPDTTAKLSQHKGKNSSPTALS